MTTFCFLFLQWGRLKDPVVWMDAAGQIFYSLGVGFGTLTLFSTGNKPQNSCYMDAIMCALGNCGTSLSASIIMYSFFGFKADYKVRKCEMDRNNSLKTNSSKPVSCSSEEIFDQVSKYDYATTKSINWESWYSRPNYYRELPFLFLSVSGSFAYEDIHLIG